MKHVVIVGGGSAGVGFLQAATKAFSTSEVQITIFEKQEYFFHVFGCLRALVDTEFIPKLFIPYDNAVPTENVNIKIRHAVVNSINYESKSVTFTDQLDHSSNQTTTYDYLIIATGSSYPSPIKPMNETRQAMTQALLETAENIKNSESILIIGGGSVGIEMAGEVKTWYPNKRVMLMDSHPELLSSQNVPKLRKAAKTALEKIGVELLLGEKLTKRITDHHFGNQDLTTESGMTIQSDAQLVCAGFKPTTFLMKDPECLDRGFIKVKDTMQVDHPAYESVFVLGDASDHPTPKMGYWAMEQGKHLAKSLAALVHTGKALQPYQGPSTEVMLLNIGRNGGVAQLPMCGGLIAGDFFMRMVKSEDLMVGMSWKNLNAEMPN